MTTKKQKRGFSLMEVLVGLFLFVVAVLGLAQIFLLAVANNRKADQVANATYLAQQQIDQLRGLTATELSLWTGAVTDEPIDMNFDGTYDFRRVTEVAMASSVTYEVSVRVYAADKIGVPDPMTLLGDPEHHRPRASVSTLITR